MSPQQVLLAAAPVTGLGAVILLAGGIRPAPLSRAADRSVLDLHVTPTHRLVDVWHDRLEELEGEGATARILHSRGLPAPSVPRAYADRISITVQNDAFRGPGGSVRDACESLDADQHVLVAEANRLVLPGWSRIVEHARTTGADVTIGRNRDGSPAGLYVIRRAALDHARRAGFVDLKEQWLSKVMRSGGRVLVHDFGEQIARSVRTRRDLLDAVGIDELHSGSLLAEGARVGDGAVVVGSAIMPGAVVDPGAVVARSVVLPGARVRSGASIVDAVVGRGRVWRDEELDPRVDPRWTNA